jgi:hypothetical protein
MPEPALADSKTQLDFQVFDLIIVIIITSIS